MASSERADDFKLPGGAKTYGEIKAQYGSEFAVKAFDLMEQMQAGKGGIGELMDLYFDWTAKNEGCDQVVLAAPPTVHPSDPSKPTLEPKPLTGYALPAGKTMKDVLDIEDELDD